MVSAMPGDSLTYELLSYVTYHAVVVDNRKKKERSQKIDDLLVLATFHSGTLVMLSSKVNGPVARGSTSSIMVGSSWCTTVYAVMINQQTASP